MALHQGKTVIIGLDGVPFDLVRGYADQGIMPNLRSIIREGAFLPMESSIPDVSSVAWSSVITGCNPGEHGIFGFTEIDRQSYRYLFPGYKELQAAPFWHGKKAAIINVPQTYPATPMDGVLISGFVSPSFEKAVFPPELLPALRDIDYRIDVKVEKAQQSMELFLEEVDTTLEGRMKCFDLLWDKEPWEIFMFVFTETDRMHHFLFDAYDNDSHAHGAAFKDFYRGIDSHIGRITAQMEADDTLIIHSDHGFCKLEQEVYLNHLLRQHGFLTFNSQSPSMITELDPAHTTAFSLDPGRIYIHTAEKFSRGTVAAGDVDSVKGDLIELFASLEFEGKVVVKNIYHNHEIFSGPCSQHGPDLVLLANRGFDLKGAVNVDGAFGKRSFTGMHTQDDAFILYKGRQSIADPFHIEKIASLV